VNISADRGLGATRTPNALGARRRTQRAWLISVASGMLVGCSNPPLPVADGDGGAMGASQGGIAMTGGAMGAFAGASGAAGAAGLAGHNTCGSNADCPPIACASAPCSQAVCGRGDDGFRHCTSRKHPPIASCMADQADCCANDADCPSGQACLTHALAPAIALIVSLAFRFNTMPVWPINVRWTPTARRCPVERVRSAIRASARTALAEAMPIAPKGPPEPASLRSLRSRRKVGSA
jgi:hypothetical protein